MRREIPQIALFAAALLLGANLSHGAQDKPGIAASEQLASRAKRDASGEVKMVDINKASATELKKLAGVGDAEAARIIAGRPYASKAELLTSDILDSGLYMGVRPHIVARQPYKSAAKNAALYRDRK